MIHRKAGISQVEAYLNRIYYNPEAIKYLVEFQKQYSQFCIIKMETYTKGSFIHSIRSGNCSGQQWYGNWYRQ